MRKFFLLILLFTGFTVKAQVKYDRSATHISNIKEYLDKGGHEWKALDHFDSLEVNSNKKWTREERISLLKWKIYTDYRTYPDLMKQDLVTLMENDPSFSPSDLPRYSEDELFRERVDHIYQTQQQEYIFVSKFRQDRDMAPFVLKVFTSKDIEALGATNIMDLLRITPGFAELGDSNERNFGTRGVSGSTVQHVLFLIDGHRVTDLLTSSTSPDWISLDYVEQVEVVRGPGSALYGGNAFSGIVNIITKNGKTFSGGQLSASIGTGATADLSSSNLLDRSMYKMNFQYGNSFNATSNFYLSGTFYRSGGNEFVYNPSQADQYYFSANPEDKQQYNETVGKYNPSYSLLMSYKSQNGISVTANAESTTMVYARSGNNLFWASDSIPRTRLDRREFLKADYDFFHNKEDRLVLSGAINLFHKDFYLNSDNTHKGVQRLLGDETRIDIAMEYTTKKLQFKDEKALTIFGFESSLNWWNYQYLRQGMVTAGNNTFPGLFYNELDNYFKPPSSGFFNPGENVAAAFVQTQRHLIEDKLQVTAGLRYNWHRQYAPLNDFVFRNHLSPRFSMVYIPFSGKVKRDKLRIKAMYGSAFLPPMFLYRQTPGIGTFIDDPDDAKGLSSQLIDSFELAMAGEIPFKGVTLAYEANVYHNEIEGLIYRQPTVSGSSYYQNYAKTYVLNGMEGELRLTLPVNSELTLTPFANITMIDSKSDMNYQYEGVVFEDSESPLLFYPSFKWSAGTGVAFRERWNIQLMANHSGKSYVIVKDEGEDQTTNEDDFHKVEANNAYTLVHANVSFKLSETLKFSLKGQNLFNKAYFLPALINTDNIGRTRGEGRLLLFTLYYKFQ
ncbi:TonB-dependent receptor [Limibacter armeniacum]|uniref:TonB-dependent receptor plug domain-containing protein n=1 Tax=Limibacter armeniacum TaxID=466084 RepID=UPI002FE55EF2